MLWSLLEFLGAYRSPLRLQLRLLATEKIVAFRWATPLQGYPRQRRKKSNVKPSSIAVADAFLPVFEKSGRARLPNPGRNPGRFSRGVPSYSPHRHQSAALTVLGYAVELPVSRRSANPYQFL
ncbi:hypothetical protein FA13DRAFT_846258 [Coprinellus micaceus]|uniref:Uncharacterized protein n=1 Tax=Coprinellus micaceus TaxID=71717 RepID=A0A4Y7S2E1_COPMI|nr:hypothetical protein FA13DRAFT_846258 [Coprinellus micaceus]